MSAWIRFSIALLAVLVAFCSAPAVQAQEQPLLMLPAPAPLPALPAPPTRLALPAPAPARPAPQAVQPAPQTPPQGSGAGLRPDGTIARVRAAVSNAAATVNPRQMVHQFRTNYREHRFYATDYSQHSSPGQAMRQSIRPLNMGANVRASMRNNMSPLSLVGTLVTPVTMEVNRQLSTDGRISPSKLARAFQPGAIVGGLAGGFVGDAMGAAAQSALAGTMGPLGPVVGFVARPIISYSAFLVCSNFGATVPSGKPSFRGALAQSLRQVDPARDLGTLVGGSVGAVIGQALIPIPVVGSIAGGMIGGMVGSVIGNWLGRHGGTGRADRSAVSWLRDRADDLDGHKPKPAKSGREPASGGGDKPERGPTERFDRDYILSAPVTQRTTSSATARPRTTGTSSEVTPDAALTSDLAVSQ